MPFTYNLKNMTGNVASTEAFEKDWHFASEEDIVLGIETAIYKNGNTAKRFPLSNGKQAVVRELLGRDMMKIDQIVATGKGEADSVEEKYFSALYHFAVKIDGQQIPMEDFANMKAKDFHRIKLSAQALNF